MEGKHRALGVHLSFVRSVGMDKWKDWEVARMKVRNYGEIASSSGGRGSLGCSTRSCMG